MPKFDLYANAPPPYQAPPRRGIALVRAFALALLAFGLAFCTAFMVSPPASGSAAPVGQPLLRAKAEAPAAPCLGPAAAQR